MRWLNRYDHGALFCCTKKLQVSDSLLRPPLLTEKEQDDFIEALKGRTAAQEPYRVLTCDGWRQSDFSSGPFITTSFETKLGDGVNALAILQPAEYLKPEGINGFSAVSLQMPAEVSVVLSTDNKMSRIGVNHFMGRAREESERLVDRLKFQYMDVLLEKASGAFLGSKAFSPAFPAVITSTFQIAGGSFSTEFLRAVHASHENPIVHESLLDECSNVNSIKRLFTDMAKKADAPHVPPAHKKPYGFSQLSSYNSFRQGKGGQPDEKTRCVSLKGETIERLAGIGDQPRHSHLVLTDTAPQAALGLVHPVIRIGCKMPS